MSKTVAEPLDFSQEHISLKKLSVIILEKMKVLRRAKRMELATLILDQVTLGIAEEVKREAIRRRCYDVINVLIASGVFAKDQKEIVYKGNPSFPETFAPQTVLEDPNVVAARIQSKEEELRSKAQVLLCYKTLIARNFGVRKPAGAITFPAIILGVDKSKLSGMHVSPQLIEIDGGIQTLFWSPLDVLKSIKQKNKVCKQLEKCVPEYQRYL